MKFRRIRVLLLVLVTLLLSMLSEPVIAQTSEPPDPPPPNVMTLEDTILLIAGGGGLGFALSFLFEKPGWLKNLSGQGRWWFIFIFMTLTPVLAQLAVTYIPDDVWLTLEPYWRSLALGFIAWGASQGTFFTVVKPNRKPQDRSLSP
jgi:hypothetical protein